MDDPAKAIVPDPGLKTHDSEERAAGLAAAREEAGAEASSRVPKHRIVFDYLHSSIQSGVYKAGDRLPSEAELGVMFGSSRITVAKAVLELQRMDLVTRRPGAGTHVQARQQTKGHTFGLLIPELGLTEIFEPICHGMMRSPFARPDSLIWGNASGMSGNNGGRLAEERVGDHAAEEAAQMAQHFVAQKVAGVFFAPLEFIADKDIVNRRIMRSLERAKIPVILLDRGYLPYPQRSDHDLVGIDNRRAGYLATEHLLRHGARKLAFLAEINAAPTVDARITGFYEALRALRIKPDADPVWRGSPQDLSFLQKMLNKVAPEAIVCANDVTAARLMQILIPLGIRVPEDIKIVGIDDVKYASLLPVPLTTMHQNCSAIGVIAMATMLERLDHPELPTRDISLPTRLVVRRSCGSFLNQT